MLRQVQWLAAGGGLPTGALGDLLLAETAAGWRLYVAPWRASDGGVATLAVDGGGALSLLGSARMPVSADTWGAAGLALLAGPGTGSGMLLVTGALRPAPEALALRPDGTPADRPAPLQGGPGPDLLDAAVLDLGGLTRIFALRATDARPQAWTVQPDGVLAATPPPAGSAPASGAPGGAGVLAAIAIDGRAVLVTTDAATHRIDSWLAAPGAAPVRVQSLGMEGGPGIAAPGAVEMLAAGGRVFAVVAGQGSDSLSVLRLSSAGTMTPVFHAIDTLHSRFEGVAALAGAEVAGRSYLVAGGGDQGISLLLLLPTGRLMHLAALPWGGQAPGHVTALAMRAAVAEGGAARLDIFAGGEEAGLARLVADLGQLAPPRDGGAAGGLLAGDARADLLTGGTGAVTLQGGAGDDILIGGPGAAVMTGGGGADLFVPAANGRLTRITDFTPGLDRIDLSGFGGLRDFARIGFAATATGARLAWADSVIEVTSTDGRALRLADFGPDPLGGLAPLPALLPGITRTGTDAADRLRGSPGNDRLEGMGGDDSLSGDGGDDLLIGGPGHDILATGPGNDTVWAGPGDDRILAGGETLEVWAGPGRDTIIGGSGDDILGGGPDDDLIDARQSGRDQLWGGDGNDTLWLGDASGTAGGGPGNDLVQGGSGGDTLIGGLGNDSVQGGDGNDALYLVAGNDQGHGGAGDDTLLAGPGFDRMWGGAGADRFEFWRGQNVNRVEDFSRADGDTIALGGGMWRTTHGVLNAAQVLDRFGRITPEGDLVLDFAAAGTTVVIVGGAGMDGLADALIIL
jgi:Ca2+-binding RTX toxin-like protein